MKLNELDDRGNIPLNLALLNRNEGIANTLVTNKCNMDMVDSNGNSLLHLAIMRGDIFSSRFLIKNGASSIQCKVSGQETPLHLVSMYKQADAISHLTELTIKESPWPAENLAEVAQLLLEYHANPDAQDECGYTPLQRAIECNNIEVFNTLLNNPV